MTPLGLDFQDTALLKMKKPEYIDTCVIHIQMFHCHSGFATLRKYWGLNKMGTILQTIFSIAFSSKDIFVFDLKFTEIIMFLKV